MDYEEFLASKSVIDPPTGFTDHGPLSEKLFPFQRDIVSWALRRGRAAIFAGTGLGKSFMELSYADQVAHHTGKPILHIAPLAVSAQMVREAEKFGISARQVAQGSECADGINITNYQKLDHFDLSNFGGVILDESSILKNETGHYRNALIQACHNIPFRLAATATPAPNDFMELGNHSEFLGVMTYTNMLAMFFQHDGGETQKWVLKGHAENAFWEWMASWCVMIRKPSDLGYANDGYDLPPLHYHMHNVDVDPVIQDGDLFPTITLAQTLSERQKAKRDSIDARVAKAVSITPNDRPFVWWTHLNVEAEMLTKAIPGSVNLHGGLKDDIKEKIILDFCDGKIQTLITKPSIMGYGINAQICADTGFVGLNDSWEMFYQAIRRFWRFGQSRPVNCHIISASTEGQTLANIKRKDDDAERMASAMVAHTRDISSLAIRGMVREKAGYDVNVPIKLPEWLLEEA